MCYFGLFSTDFSSAPDFNGTTSLQMGPKKDRPEPQTKTIKCSKYDRGFCKYKEECLKIHPDKVCEDANCFSDKFDKRHPNPLATDVIFTDKICAFIPM